MSDLIRHICGSQSILWQYETCSLVLSCQSQSQPRAAGRMMPDPKFKTKKGWPLGTCACDQIWRKLFADVIEELQVSSSWGWAPNPVSLKEEDRVGREGNVDIGREEWEHTGQGRVPVTRRQENRGIDPFLWSPREIGPMQPCSWLSIPQNDEGTHVCSIESSRNWSFITAVQNTHAPV